MLSPSHPSHVADDVATASALTPGRSDHLTAVARSAAPGMAAEGWALAVRSRSLRPLVPRDAGGGAGRARDEGQAQHAVHGQPEGNHGCAPVFAKLSATAAATSTTLSRVF